MYLFNRITVNPQLPKRIEKLSEIANNLWWSWNTEFLRLFQRIDGDLWEESNKNPVKGELAFAYLLSSTIFAR